MGVDIIERKGPMLAEGDLKSIDDVHPVSGAQPPVGAKSSSITVKTFQVHRRSDAVLEIEGRGEVVDSF